MQIKQLSPVAFSLKLTFGGKKKIHFLFILYVASLLGLHSHGPNILQSK